MPKTILYRGAVYTKFAADNIDFVYHVTRKSALPMIHRKGLVPQKPVDMEDEVAVYLFSSRNSAEEAVMNWLGDRFDEEEELVLLQIDPTGLDLRASPAGYELLSYLPVPPSSIVSVEDI